MWLEKTESTSLVEMYLIALFELWKTRNHLYSTAKVRHRKKKKVVIVVHTKMCIAQWIRLEAKCWLVMFGQREKLKIFDFGNYKIEAQITVFLYVYECGNPDM